MSLLPDAETLHLEALVADERGITIVATTTGDSAACPDCGRPSTHVHSRRRRHVADLPWQGLAVRLDLQLRRFYCGAPGCARRTFTERVPAVVAPYARRTVRLAAVVEAIAFALGGEGGARLLAALGLQVSPDALLNTIRTAGPPEAPTPRVIGIDDWAWRRGHHFGTIIVDLERHAVLDLLADRAIASVVTWLQAHPQVTTIARDRSGVYAEAARTAAPQATQVADRWHLVHNLAAVLEEFLLHHRSALRAACAPAPVTASDAGAPGPLTPHRPRHGQQRATEASQQRQARLVEQYEAIHRLHIAGADVADIARRVGVSRRTVYRYRNLSAPPEPPRPHRPARQRVVAPFEPYLLGRWQEGCHNGMRLYREIRAQGYAYGASSVMRFVAELRRDEAAGRPAGTTGRARAAPTPTARHVAGLFLRRPTDLHPEQQAYLDRLCAADEAVATTYRLTQDFVALVRERGGARLDAWLAEVESDAVLALRRFAAGLRADLDAVRAGLTETWSNGTTEGFVHKLKLVKRQMYGRAGFAVLRRRVLARAG
ncbi:MAG TPA: ISL3 family transposase [Thermomicrobiales bacterium]|jgi:transposase|nr:ISL3 family transposase [Thermomicrobiales bacterium]